ncbi:hypothetical protein SASPL_157241 [Salvia splendens]|uniref:MI domain-containing protein n=1 Tax=Salvia splendens TaxID=180675 RepID=A0A8X8VVF8_SALSN|nr:hypothetical protein SASPL_157241 [Salvia splendens]
MKSYEIAENVTEGGSEITRLKRQSHVDALISFSHSAKTNRYIYIQFSSSQWFHRGNPHALSCTQRRVFLRVSRSESRLLLQLLLFPLLARDPSQGRRNFGRLARGEGEMASREGFLTEQQREMLKIASQNAEVMSSLSMASSPKSPGPKSPGQNSSLVFEHNHVKAPGGGHSAAGGGVAVRHVRRSHSGKAVRVKKDGAGGKGTWGKLLDTDGESFLDRNDPNYDSGEEPYELVGSTVSDPLDEYKKAVVSLVEEYFSTGDVDVAASDLRELGSSEYHPYFIKRLVSLAMDRNNKEKEMASVLLSALYADVINSAQISQGFFMLLESADDLTVDILDAKTAPESSKGFQVLQTAEKSYLSAPHHAELVERRWGGSTHCTADEVKKKIADLLREYVESGDTSEACRCIRQLGVSFFHHEVVKRALVIAMENQSAESLILNLLKEAAEEGLISSSQMAKGFSRLAESLDDLALDIPSAKKKFQFLVPRAISEGWLDASFVKSSADEGVGPDENDEKLRRYKKEVVSIIHEYFHSDDIPELIRSLEDLGMPEYNPVFLKKLITLAMDRKNREKEMASVLLSALHIEIFTTEDMVSGFVMLLESAEDTALDIIDASNELAFFLARAVIDDVAHSSTPCWREDPQVLGWWHGWAVEDAKDKIQKLLEEYESGGVVSEACQCIRDLGMPFFNHEVVKKALVMAMEKKNDRMLELLQECFGEGLITINQMTKGFNRIKDSLDDLALDIPNAKDKFTFYVEHAKKHGWLLQSFV